MLLPLTLAFMLGALGYPVLLEMRRVRFRGDGGRCTRSSR